MICHDALSTHTQVVAIDIIVPKRSSCGYQEYDAVVEEEGVEELEEEPNQRKCTSHWLALLQLLLSLCIPGVQADGYKTHQPKYLKGYDDKTEDEGSDEHARLLHHELRCSLE